MNIIIVPGFWLDASSWDDVTPPLTAAGIRSPPLGHCGPEGCRAHRCAPLDAVVANDRLLRCACGPRRLLGGGAIIYAAAYARPERVARTIYVDSGPLTDGGVINDELPPTATTPASAVELFDDADIIDLTDDLAPFSRPRDPAARDVALYRQQLTDDAVSSPGHRHRMRVLVCPCSAK